MKPILVCLIILFFSVLELYTAKKVNLLSTSPKDVDNYWENYKSKFNRTHKNKTQEALKRKTFEKNIKKINDLNEKYNNGTLTYVSGLNRFSDLTSDEFLAYVNKGLVNITVNPNENNENFEYEPSSKQSTSIDWREKGYVNPIQNQGGCGSCWAFSAAASLEGQYFKQTNKLVKFSEQNLVDCVYDRDGCDGGLMHDAYDYILKNNGVSTQTGYKYTSGSTTTWSGTCKYNSATAGVQITGYKFVSVGSPNEAAIVSALNKVGPLAAALYVTNNFQFYQSGVFNDPLCDNLPLNYINHAISLVGYGTENGQDYYILRNSWDTDWGEGGYMKIARNKNMCNIGTFVLYPNVKSNANTTTTQTTTRTTTTSTTPSTTRSRTTTPINSEVINFNLRNLTQLDESLFKNYTVSLTKSLNLNNNQFKVLKANVFAKFKSLVALSLSNNRLSVLEPGWTNGLDNLKVLYLDFNLITNLSNDAFTGLRQLDSITLFANPFRFTSKLNAPFSTLFTLTTLDLSRTKLGNTIGSNTFKYLNKLRWLYLRNTNITKLSADAFKNPFCSPNISQTVIYIGGNPIANTDSSLLTNTECYSFDLS